MNFFKWLACPIMFVVAHWALLHRGIVSVYPALWTTAGKGVAEVLPPHPKTRTQAFDLGVHVSYYSEHCVSEEEARSERCMLALRQSGETLGAPEPLSAKQLLGMRPFIVELDAQRSIADRVFGFFNFVNIVWLISIVGILATVGPFIAYLAGPFLMRLATQLFERVLRPTAMALHSWGVFEIAAYALAFGFSAQGCRYPDGQSQAAKMVALTGGLAFAPCWVYSTTLHTTSSGGKENEFFCLSCMLMTFTLVPLAILHDSRLIGFLAVLSTYGALGFVFLAFGSCFVIGFSSRNATHRCIVASVALVLGFTCLRLAGVDPACLRPFATGAMCLGNVMYFLAMLILSAGWRSGEGFSYTARQALMTASLTAALLVGNVFAIPSMSNTASTFLVLWLMEKELEVQWGGAGIVVVFLNFVFLYYIAHYLNTHPEHIMSMFDPSGLYATE